MPDLSHSTQLVFPTSGTVDSYALVDYEQAKFINQGGTACVRVYGNGGTTTSVGETTSYLGTVVVGSGKSAGEILIVIGFNLLLGS